MEEEKNNEENLPVGIGADNLIQMAEFAEKRINAIKRIKMAALKVTSIHDWVDQSGRPYLQVSGSEKVARLFGISWRIDEPQKITSEDGHFSYTYKGYFTLGSASIEFEGSRGSKDVFFSKSHETDIPPSEIDENDVKKAALTNLLGNGITRILGIRNLTWEDLETAEIDRNKVVKITYGKPEMTEDAQELRGKIEEMLIDMSNLSKVEFARLLNEFTSFTAKDGKVVRGKSKLEDISEKSIPVVYGKVKKAYEEFDKERKSNGTEQGKLIQ
jgi:hypothetical protein